MRKIIEFFVRQNVFADLLTVSIIGLGIYSAFNIKREIFPNVTFDIITVTTIFPGAAPEEVEKLVTNPLEQDLKEVDGIKRMTSYSTESRSVITIYLDPDQTTEREAKADIQDVVDRFNELPEGAEDPEVVSLESKQGPIVEVSIAGDIPEMELRDIARTLEEEIESIDGVARVVHRGLRDVEVWVEADQNLLSRYRVSLDDMIAAIKRQNVSIPGGTIEVSEKTGGRERIVRTIGDFADLNDVKNTVIRANDLGAPVRVGQVAKVSYALERTSILNRTRGYPSLSLTILKKEAADAIDLVDQVKARLEELKPTLDSRLSVEFINDASYYVRRRLSILVSNLAIGLGLVLLLLPLTMPFRSSLVIALGVPFAIMGTVALTYVFGGSINLISMIGMIMMAGILVDDAIVVTENSIRKIEDGLDPKQAAIEGARQVVAPVSASVLTTAMAFLPMAFMTGIFGKFVFQIPMAVITALAVSVFEAFLILPTHVAHFVRPIKRDAAPRTNVFARLFAWTRQVWDLRLVPVYARVLKWCLRKRYWVVAGLVVLLVGSMGLAGKGMKFILFPPEGIEIFFVRTDAPLGTTLEKHAQLIKPIEQAVAALPKEELDTFTSSLGIQQQEPNDPFTRTGAEYGQITVYLTPETMRERTAWEVIEDLRAKVGKPEGLEKITFERVNPGPPQGKPVSIGVRAKTYDKILPAVAELKRILNEMKGVTDISDTYMPGKEELRVNVNSAEAAAGGLSVSNVGNTVRAAYEGVIASSIRKLDEEIDVRVMLSKKERSSHAALEDLSIPNSVGNLIPLGRISRVTKSQSLAVYEHEDNTRQVKVNAEVDTQVTTATEANGKVRDLIPDLEKKFPGVSFDFGGEDEDTRESMESLMRAFVVAVIGIFLLLVLTFKNILQPTLVLLTIPLGVIAVIWAFFLHGMPLSFMGMLGIVALAGVIVNNAIVLMDFINQARAEGMDRWQSIEKAATIRIRPIMLTTMTTILGVLPTAYGLGGLDMFVVPIAMALGWGMAFGSVLTAIVFPSAIAILDDITEVFGRKFKRGGAPS